MLRAARSRSPWRMPRARRRCIGTRMRTACGSIRTGKPGGEQEYQEQQVERRFERPEVRLLQRSRSNGVALIAQNTYFAPVQIAFRLQPIENVSAETPRSGLAVLPPRSETELVVVGKSVEHVELRFESEFRVHARASPAPSTGPSSRTGCRTRCRRAVRVSQAYPGHEDAHGSREPARRRFRDADRHRRVRGARRRRHRGRERLLRERHELRPSTVRARTSCASCTTTARWRSTCT